MIRKLLTSALSIIAITSALTISTYAAFVSTATVSGIQFSTGRAELKIFGNIGYTHAGNNGNLTPNLPGPSFEGIGPNWMAEYPLKYMNTGTVYLATSLRAEIQEDPANLADDIYVQVWQWNDVDGDGQVDKTGDSPDQLTELGSAVTLASLVDNPLSLVELPAGNPAGLIFRFSTNDLANDTQNQHLKIKLLLDGTTVANIE